MWLLLVRSFLIWLWLANCVNFLLWWDLNPIASNTAWHTYSSGIFILSVHNLYSKLGRLINLKVLKLLKVFYFAVTNLYVLISINSLSDLILHVEIDRVPVNLIWALRTLPFCMNFVCIFILYFYFSSGITPFYDRLHWVTPFQVCK